MIQCDSLHVREGSYNGYSSPSALSRGVEHTQGLPTSPNVLVLKVMSMARCGHLDYLHPNEPLAFMSGEQKSKHWQTLFEGFHETGTLTLGRQFGDLQVQVLTHKSSLNGLMTINRFDMWCNMTKIYSSTPA